MGKGIIGGLIAGLVFMITEMILVATLGGGSAYGPPRMIAAIGMGRDVLPPPATFDMTIMIVGMLIHFALSAVLGAIFALVVDRMRISKNGVIAAGLIFGLLVYLVNFYLMTGLFPWFEMARNWITIVAHLLFGGILGAWVAQGHVDRRGPA